MNALVASVAKVLYLPMTPWLSFSENFACDPAPGTGSGDVALIQGNLIGADINKTLALGTLLDSDEGQGSVLLSNIEDLGVVGHKVVVMGRWGQRGLGCQDGWC